MTKKNHHPKGEASKVAATVAVVDTQKASLQGDLSCLKTNVTYVTAIDSSSFICKRCCRSLAACSCPSTADTIGTRCRIEDWPNNVDYNHRRRLNDNGESASLKSADNFTAPPSRSGRGLHQQGSVDPSHRELGSIVGNRPGLGRQDVEMRRMMDSLETIDSEWTSSRQTRLTQPIHQASDMNNNDSGQARRLKTGNIGDEHPLIVGHLDERETLTNCFVSNAS